LAQSIFVQGWPSAYPMSRIVAAPWFLLLLLATTSGGAAIDSNRSLLSARDVENIRAAKAYAAKCDGSKSKVGKIHTHVYHIYEGGSGYGLQEHNAGDTIGDLSFVFPRGFQAYYKGGYIAMLHVGVTKWGGYLHCNHSPGSHTYSCNGGFQEQAGRERKGGGGYWYSFPARGKDKQWSEIDAKSGPCMMIRIKAKCLFNLMAKAGGRCPHGCDSLSYFQCSQCMGGISLSHQKQIWDNAIYNNKCHRYTTEVDDELNDDLDPDGAFTNTSRSEARRVPPQPPADSSSDTTMASTDKGVIVV
jgi:hypothetical protein